MLQKNPPPEKEALARYSLARCYLFAEEKEKAREELCTLLALLPPEEAKQHPQTSYWVVKGIGLLERMAEQAPTPELLWAVRNALKWLEKSALQDQKAVNRRNHNLQELERQLEEARHLQTAPQQSQFID